MSPSETAAPERLHGLDALRGGALLLGVVLHAALSYFSPHFWIVPDDGSPVANVIVFGIHMFRMTTFFLIAGLFAHLMLARRGTWAFIKDRSSRIIGPLFGFWWLTFPAFVAVLIWMAAINNGGTLPTDAPPPPAMTVGNFPLTHLWFLWVLMILYVAVLILRAPFALLDRTGAWGRIVDRITGALIGPWTPALAAIPLAAAFWLKPDWIPFFGVPTPDAGLVPNPVALTAFGTAFGLGFLLDRRRDLLTRIEASWAPLTLAAVGIGTAAFILSGGVPTLEPIQDPSMKTALAWVYALGVFTGTFAAVGLALRFASGHSPVRRYLADASYWVYIIHLPLVLVGQVLLLDVPAPWWAKLLINLGGTMALSLLTYELLIRHTFMGTWLNGRRVPWRRRPDAAAVPAE